MEYTHLDMLVSIMTERGLPLPPLPITTTFTNEGALSLSPILSRYFTWRSFLSTFILGILSTFDIHLFTSENSDDLELENLNNTCRILNSECDLMSIPVSCHIYACSILHMLLIIKLTSKQKHMQDLVFTCKFYRK